jgi:hypothetical protein
MTTAASEACLNVDDDLVQEMEEMAAARAAAQWRERRAHRASAPCASEGGSCASDAEDSSTSSSTSDSTSSSTSDSTSSRRGSSPSLAAASAGTDPEVDHVEHREGVDQREAQASMEVALPLGTTASIHHNPKGGNMYARCSKCRFVITRTLRGGRRGGGQQGRPIGFLAAWLAIDCGGNRDRHRVAAPSWQARREARSLLAATAPNYARMHGLERATGDGEGSEPEVMD